MKYADRWSFAYQVFSQLPKVQVTVKHTASNQLQDAMSVWIESLSRSQFEVCLRESRTFDGPHSNLVVVCRTRSLFDINPIKLRLSILLQACSIKILINFLLVPIKVLENISPF